VSEEELLLNRLLTCTIANGYAGVDEFKAFACVHPEAALRITWTVLTGREDPGRDDGALCIELLEIVTEAAGRQAVEELVLGAWSSLSDPIRRNIVVVAGSAKAMSAELAIKLFNHPDTRIEQRHRIVAGLAAGDERPGREGYVVDLAKRIGSYSDSDRQTTLDRFVASVVRNYS
jgi:hypothetical protein